MHEFEVVLDKKDIVVVDIKDYLEGTFVFSKPVKSYETKAGDFNKVVDFETNKEDGNILKMHVRELKKQLRMLNFKIRCADGSDYLLVLMRKTSTFSRWGEK